MKNKIKWVLVTTIVTLFSVQGAYALSLKLKKEQKSTQEKIDKELTDIKKNCGCTPAVQIDWESFKDKSDFPIASRNMQNISSAMANVCKDFKAEVCKGIKTIKIGKGSSISKSLKDGVLEEKIPAGNQSWGADQVQKLIEENL